MSIQDRSDVMITHHWMFKMRGGEKVLEQLCKVFPKAGIACLTYERQHLSPALQSRSISASILQRLRLARRFYKELLPLHPFAISKMKIPAETKLVVASDASMIKGIPVPEDCLLVCYCHSPPRYLWEMSDVYASKTAGLGLLAKYVFKCVIPFCKRFDWRASRRVDLFIANSDFVSRRIRRCYDRPSVVVHPPVDVSDFDATRKRSDFYLVVSELVSYKRIDLAIEAFNDSGLPLVIIGDGPERKKLEAMASDNIKFLGRQPFDVLKEHYETCRGFIFPGVEDFGITPLEAQAAGAPVVALGIGGALETVKDRETGVFFESQTAASLNDAIEQLQTLYDLHESDLAKQCVSNAARFGAERFRQQTTRAIENLIASRAAAGQEVKQSTAKQGFDQLPQDATAAT